MTYLMERGYSAIVTTHGNCLTSKAKEKKTGICMELLTGLSLTL